MTNGHVDRGGHSIYYEVTGQGSDLLMIPGIGVDIISWTALINEMARDYRVVAIDNRDVGRSSDATGGYTVADMADDAAAVLDVLGLASVHVLGFSMGGMIAQEFALRYPDKVDRLVLYATTAKMGSVHASILDGWEWLMHTDPDGDRRMKFALSMVVSQKFLDDPAMVAQAIELGKAHPYRQTAERFSRQAAATRKFDAVDRVSGISAPTLVLVGERDQLVPPWHSADLANWIPGADLKVIPRYSHCIFYEAPELIRDEVVSFTGKG